MIKTPRRIVVTGLGTVNPIGLNVQEFWKNLCELKSGVRKIANIEEKPYVDYGSYYVHIAAEVDLPDVRDYFKQRKLARRLDRNILFGHVAGVQAIRDAGLSDYEKGNRVAVLIGTGDGGIITHYEQIVRAHTLGLASVNPFYIPAVIPNTCSALLAMEFGFSGPSFSINSACASSNHSFGLAYSMINSNIVDVVIAGGTEAPIANSAIAGFGQIGALSTRNNDPETASRPFDRDRDGFVLGEGAGVLCLEELEHAKKRGAYIYAELAGFGFSTDAYDLVAPHPDGLGAAQAMQFCLNMSDQNPEDIGFINCHGTSTPIGDKAEYVAISRVFGKHTPDIPVNSTKSMIGHLLGGASGTEAIASLMAFEQGVIHPTANQFNLDPEIHYNVVKTPMEKKVDSFLSNGFGFGGQNACVIFKRFKE